MTKDISRLLFQPRKHYLGVRMEQGRSMLDSGWNENERVRDEDLRRTAFHMLGCHASPGCGLAIDRTKFEQVVVIDHGVVVAIAYDFEIGPGAYWLGGLRFEIAEPERLRFQRDWLQLDPATDLPPFAGLLGRTDLVVMKGWEQSVTPVEDDELFEKAIGVC